VSFWIAVGIGALVLMGLAFWATGPTDT